MLEAMGERAGDLDETWRRASTTWFEERLQDPTSFAAVVVAEPGGRVVASAAGLCQLRAPTPHNLSGLTGRVFNVATDPAHRRQGLAGACLRALLDWFVQESPAGVIELSASPEGHRLCRSLGFREAQHPILQLAPASTPQAPAEGSPC